MYAFTFFPQVSPCTQLHKFFHTIEDLHFHQLCQHNFKQCFRAAFLSSDPFLS